MAQQTGKPTTMAALFFGMLVMAMASAAGPAPAPLSQPWQRHTIDKSSRGADGVRLRDVNGDGLLDIATGWEEGGIVRAYLNPGPRAAKNIWPAVTVGKAGAVEDAVFVDLDGDGAVDVVSASEGGVKTMWVHWAPKTAGQYLNPKAWCTEALPASRKKQSWMYCVPMQLDVKNGIDLMAGAKNRGANIGWFESPQHPRRLADWTWHPIYDAGWIMSMVPVDMDRDGDADLIVSDRRGKNRGVSWLENPGPGPAQSRPWPIHWIGGRDREVMFLKVVDLDGDGRRDVLTAIRERALILFRRTGIKPAAWEASTIALPDNIGMGKAVNVGDINLDGRPDIVFTCGLATGERHGVMWLSCKAKVTDPDWHAHAISGGTGIKYDLVELIDMDGDGDLDVLTCEEQTNLGVFWYENPAR